jgi:mycobactin peptide synthetase MbtF
MYRTGDQVTRLADGNLVFHGRGDDQVKVNGYRVELAEVESGLTRLPAVTSAVAVLRRAAAGTRLEAFVTVRPSPGGSSEATPTGADLRRALQRDLPSHLVPAAVHVLPALPTNPQRQARSGPRCGRWRSPAARAFPYGGPAQGRGPREGHGDAG